MEKIYNQIIFCPFSLVPFNVLFRHKKHWCKRYPSSSGMMRHGIVIFEDKTFDVQSVSYILDDTIIVGMLKDSRYE